MMILQMILHLLEYSFRKVYIIELKHCHSGSLDAIIFHH